MEVEVIEKLDIIEGYLGNIVSMNYIILISLAAISIIYLFYKFLKIFI